MTDSWKERWQAEVQQNGEMMEKLASITAIISNGDCMACEVECQPCLLAEIREVLDA